MSDTGFTWDHNPQDAFRAYLDAYVKRIVDVVTLLLQSYAPRIEAWMKANAPWTDRTGNARQSLYAAVESLIDGAAVFFDYGVEYGFWLEYANQGTYAIIAPALDYFQPLIWADVARILGG